MRPITLALSAAALIVAMTGAQASLTPMIDRPIGTLTCVTRSDLGLVIGRATAADCTFRPVGGGEARSYLALLPNLTGDGPVSQTTLAWRVSTRQGVDRPDVLAGSFTDPAVWSFGPRSATSSLMGGTAVLRPISTAGSNEGQPQTMQLAANPSAVR